MDITGSAKLIDALVVTTTSFAPSLWTCVRLIFVSQSSEQYYARSRLLMKMLVPQYVDDASSGACGSFILLSSSPPALFKLSPSGFKSLPSMRKLLLHFFSI